LDYSRLFEYNPAARVKKLRNAQGNITLVVEGYDSIREELWEIPQVREFWVRVHLHWPVWLYIANLNNDAFKMIAGCVIKNAIAIKHDGNCDHELFLELNSLCRFFENGIPFTVSLQVKAGFPKFKRVAQLRSVGQYLGISQSE